MLEALGGLLIMRTTAAGRPVLHQSNAIPYAAGTLLALGALAALVADRRDSLAQAVFVRALDAVLLLVEPLWNSYQQYGVSPSGNWGNVNYQVGTIRAADGYVMAYTPAPLHWDLLCTGLIDRPDLLARPEFASVEARALNIEELRSELAEWFSARTREDIFRQALEILLPFGAFLRPEEQLSDPQNKARGVFRRWGPDSRVIDLNLPFPWDATPLPPRRPLEKAKSARQTAGPLAGLRVAEMGAAWAGPLAGRFLRGLGADVIQVEPPTRFDANTWGMSPSADDSASPTSIRAASNFAAGKRSVVIDARQSAGNAALQAILQSSDVLLVNLSARVLPQLGLDDRVLRDRLPHLSVVQMTGYGSKGPYAHFPAYGIALEAQSGLWASSLGPNGEPLLVDSCMSDPVAGMFAAIAVVAERLGLGRAPARHLDLSERECILWLQGDSFADRGRIDSAVPPSEGPTPVQCADGWLIVIATASGDFEPLSLDNDESGGRLQRDVIHEVASSGGMAVPVRSAAEVAKDPGLIGTALLPVKYPGVGWRLAVSSGLGFERSTLDEPGVPATPGANSSEVLAECGWTDSQIDAVRDELLASHTDGNQDRVMALVSDVRIWERTNAIISYDPDFQQYLDQIGEATEGG